MSKLRTFQKVFLSNIDLSFILSILFVIALFTAFSSGFDEQYDILTVKREKPENIVVIPLTKHPEPRPPKPDVPSVSIGDIVEEDYVPEEIEYTEYTNSESMNIPELPHIEDDDEPESEWMLTRKPKLISYNKSKYPILAKRNHVEGNVFLEYVIDEKGNVTNIKIISGHLFLTDDAIETLKSYKYEPGMRYGKTVRVKMTKLFKYKLK